MRTLHVAIAIDENSNKKAIEILQNLLDLSYRSQEIAGYRIWLATKEEIDTHRAPICSFLANLFEDYKED
ncbi:MAG TPA: hypothetical protein P5136_00210 [Methanofastidiosum sp.]|nr:hypothetical protein [Methanofastidiosum sp.]